jgi:hypothetical protein
MPRGDSPVITLEVEGVEHALRFSVAAVADFRDATGIDLMRQALDRTAPPETLATLAWACAGGPDTGMTVREFQRSVTFEQFSELGEKIRRVVERDNPLASKAQAKKAAKRKA